MSERFGKGYCEQSLAYDPISKLIPGVLSDVSLLMLLSGLLNILMSALTIVWIKRNEVEAQAEGAREEAAKSVIFPVFVKVLWASAIINVFAGITMSLLPIRPESSNSSTSATTFAAVRALKHCVVEGIAFLLMQKGCGSYAVKRAGCYTLAWGLLTLFLYYFSFKNGGFIFDLLDESWNGAMLVFYSVLWLAPQTKLFRRPAAILYAKFWTIYRLTVIVINILFFFNKTDNLGACGYILVELLFLSVAQPLVCYWTLLQDSRWWQGLDIYQGKVGNTNQDIRTPLVGAEFALFSAQSLANTMDHMHVHGQVKMLNFASLKLDTKKMLGAGSFSKVYRGTYRGKECAIKLIYTADLTAAVIKRVAAEASILSSIRHPNIVNIFGVSVMPPSVCLILEICSFGSLSDIIRGYGYDWNITHRAPLSLSHTDTIFLALGCARGLAAVHAYDSSMCHRDVKSFNFLVDHAFNVKIADLELGIAAKGDDETETGSVAGSTTGSIKTESSLGNHNQNTSNNGSTAASNLRKKRSESETHILDDLLANWLAPEAVRYKVFEQYSDIFALGTVMWEIISGLLPFDRDSQISIRQKILEGYRHPIPIQYKGTPIANIISRCWAEDPNQRPTGEEVVARLEKMLRDECASLVGDIETVPQTSALRDYYELHHRNNSRKQTVTGSSYTRNNSLRSESNYESDMSWASGGSQSRLWRSLTGYARLPTTPEENNLSSSVTVTHPTDCDSDSEDQSVAGTDGDLEKQSGTYNMSRKNTNFSTSKLSEYSAISHSPLPPQAVDVIKSVRAESFWRNLEAHGGAWAVVTVEAPHVVMHATTKWHQLFQIPTSTEVGQNQLESLVGLSDTYSAAMNQIQCAASPSTSHHGAKPLKTYGSNTYATSSSNVTNNDLSSAALFRGMAATREVHGVMCFHLPGRGEMSSSDRGLKSLSAVCASGQEGYDLMCTVHAYPVYPMRTANVAIPQHTVDSSGRSVTMSGLLSQRSASSSSWIENTIFGSGSYRSGTGSATQTSSLMSAIKSAPLGASRSVPVVDKQVASFPTGSSLISNISVHSDPATSPADGGMLEHVSLSIPIGSGISSSSASNKPPLPQPHNSPKRSNKHLKVYDGPAYYAVLFSELKEHAPQLAETSSSPRGAPGDFRSSHSNRSGGSNRNHSRASFSLSGTLSNLKSSLNKSWSVSDLSAMSFAVHNQPAPVGEENPTTPDTQSRSRTQSKARTDSYS